MEDLWDILDDIDQNTWVLEPERPTYSTTTRRVALGNHCSLQITVDVNRPRSVPECRFLGADSVVMQLREQLNKNLHKWNSTLTVRNNLELILQISFPSPKTTKKEDFSMECAICYAYRLENDIPDRVCDNNKCSKAFHRVCLYEWLRAIPTTRQSFDTMFGACPYCSTPISVKIS
jgi:E3 ubiquitin-protein ligase FANCL